MPRYAHAINCACDLCRMPEMGCPSCGEPTVYGVYLAYPPYKWLWMADPSTANIKKCPACGAALPDRGIHPDAPKETS